jgi:hypothetical protein
MLRATISYMSVSDPAPLPRLGEVFFDVRGNSRSMRLSWYADTGVAVFSIWQAGMCTGTFRLPIADLSRMIEILERGPAPRGRGHAPVSAAQQGEERGSDADWYYGPAGEEAARPGSAGPGGYGAEHPADYNRSGYEADYGQGERGPAEYGAGYGRGRAADHSDADLDPAGYGAPGSYRPAADYGPADHGPADYGPADYGAADYGPADHGPADYGATDYGATGERYRGGGYSPAGQAGSGEYQAHGYPAEYEQGDHAEGGGYRRGYEPGGYESGGYGSGGYGAADAEYRTGEYSDLPGERRPGSDRGYLPGDYDDRQEFRTSDHRRADGGFRRGEENQLGTETDGSTYRHERFVAPYADDGGPAYPNDNPARPSGYPGDFGDGGYPADRRPVSPSDRYPEPAPPEEAYSYGADYRYR